MMIDRQLRQIAITTKRLLTSTLLGDYRSIFRGSGLEFDRLAVYVPGDDVRSIDWRASRRMNVGDSLLVRQYTEDRDRTVIFMVDSSASSRYSTTEILRNEMMIQVACVLASIAEKAGDRVGLLLFSDVVELWMPPQRGAAQVIRLQKKLLTHQYRGKGTSIHDAVSFLLKRKIQNALIFILSDWIDDTGSYDKILRVAAKKHDCIALRFLDAAERTFFESGSIELEDPETGIIGMLDFDCYKKISESVQRRIVDQNKVFSGLGLDLADFIIGESYIVPLISLFARRMRSKRN